MTAPTLAERLREARERLHEVSGLVLRWDDAEVVSCALSDAESRIASLEGLVRELADVAIELGDAKGRHSRACAQVLYSDDCTPDCVFSRSPCLVERARKEVEK
jgi:hypothetical protein